MSEKYKRKYLLGEGWFLPYYKKTVGFTAGLQDKTGKVVHLTIPDIDSGDKDCPKYRLILERIK